MARLRSEQVASSSQNAANPPARRRSTPQALSSAVGLPSPSASTKSGSTVEHSIASHGPYKAAGGASSVESPQQTNPGVAHIIKKLKNAIGARGTKGILGLNRRFRMMDNDNDGLLSMVEFKKAIKDVMLGISDEDVRLLFKNFDK